MATEVPTGTRRRWLRPGDLVPVGEQLWVLDHLHPVAAVLDARTGEVRSVVGWSEVSTHAAPRSRRVRAADDGIWVQQSVGPVLLVRQGTPARGYVSRGLTLAAVSAHGAWCASMRALGVTAGSDGQHGVERSELRLLDPDGRSSTVWVEGDARSVRSGAGDLFVEVGHRSDGSDPSPPATQWLRLRTGEPVPDRLTPSSHGCPLHEVPSRRPAGEVGARWAATGPARTRPADDTVGLLRVDVRAGTVESVLGPHSVEITDHAWPLVPPPPEAEDHTEDCLARFDHLDHHWTDLDGRRRPLVEGMSDSTVALDGDWPDTRLVITFAWADRPGLRLRRTIPLYDELGRVADPEYADITLMEDLDTNRVPPASAAVSGVLDL